MHFYMRIKSYSDYCSDGSVDSFNSLGTFADCDRSVFDLWTLLLSMQEFFFASSFHKSELVLDRLGASRSLVAMSTCVVGGPSISEFKFSSTEASSASCAVARPDEIEETAGAGPSNFIYAAVGWR